MYVPVDAKWLFLVVVNVLVPLNNVAAVALREIVEGAVRVGLEGEGGRGRHAGCVGAASVGYLSGSAAHRSNWRFTLRPR